MIVVTGASGLTGQEVVKQLVAGGHKVRVFVRDRQKADKTFGALGVEVRTGDFDDEPSMEAAFAGAERMFLLCPVDVRQLAWNEHAVNAAKRAGVKHIVRFSGIAAAVDAQSELLREHAIADDRLLASGIGATVLRPNSFFQNMYWAQVPIRAKGRFFLPIKDARQSLVDVRDVAGVAVRILTDAIAEHAGKTYVVTGAEALTFHDVATRLSRATKREIKYIDVPPEEAVANLLRVGVPEWNAKAVTEFRKVVATGACADVTDVVPRLLGRAPRTFDAFADENVAVFTPQTKEETMSDSKSMNVRQHFADLGQRLDRDPARTAGVTGTWQFNLSGDDGGSFFVEILDGKPRVAEGEAAVPGVTIGMTVDDYVAMATKQITGAELFMSGRMRVKGDPMLGMKAESIFG